MAVVPVEITCDLMDEDETGLVWTFLRDASPGASGNDRRLRVARSAGDHTSDVTRAEAPELALPVPLVTVLPDFADELAEAIRFEDGAELADQVRGLSITAVCGCRDDFCASFYTGPRPDGTRCAQHRNVTPETAIGVVILDVGDGRIRASRCSTATM